MVLRVGYSNPVDPTFLFMCCNWDRKERGLFIDALNPQYSPFQTSEIQTSPKNGCPTLLIPLTVAHQAPLSKGLSWQEHWSGFPFPPHNIIGGVKLGSAALQVVSLPAESTGKPST